MKRLAQILRLPDSEIPLLLTLSSIFLLLFLVMWTFNKPPSIISSYDLRHRSNKGSIALVPDQRVIRPKIIDTFGGGILLPKPTPILASEAHIDPPVVVELAVAQTPPPPPKPQPVTSGGCVTGYSTGNYPLDQIISHESGGRSCATNPGGCFGLLQACPGAPLRNACGGDPDCQIAWFTANKLGGRTWDEVWASWQIKGWW